MKNLFKITLVAILAIAIYSCSKNNDDPTPVNTVSNKQVIENYAKLVHQNYLDSYNSAIQMRIKIQEFTANPNAATMQAAKDAWISAREFYGQTEVFRGSNGPIDSEGGESWAINNEGQLNAWPLDEAYIDYVKEKNAYAGTYDVSIIGGTEVITKALLIGKNQPESIEDEEQSEKAVSTGWHAIEFLLWGQDETNPSEKKAGQRPVTDYTTDQNAERRKTYLKEVTDLLIDDLNNLVATWATGGTYYKVFMALDENKALLNILNGPQFLATSELSNERMLAPATGSGGIDESGQEDEHSCFSDNTHRDVYTNAKGIINVLRGSYGVITGASFIDLLKQKDAAQAVKLEASIDAMWAKIQVIDNAAKSGTPFDLLIMQEGKNNPGPVMNGDAALKALGDVIHESAEKLGINTVTKFD